MNKITLCQYLDRHAIVYERLDHPAVSTIADAVAIVRPHPETPAKNFFLRDDKKEHYYLLTIKADKKINLNTFRHIHQLRRLSFASADDLHTLLDLPPGAVGPFGLLNDHTCRVQWFLDRSFLQPPGRIALHPNDNTATLWLNTSDLLAFLEKHGHPCQIVEI